MSAPLEWPAASATPFRFQQIQVSKVWKFTFWIHSWRWKWSTALKKLIQRTLADPKNMSWPIGRSNIFSLVLPQKISKDRDFSILKRWKENGTEFPTSEALRFMPAERMASPSRDTRMASPSRDTGSWPDSCGRTMVKYFTSSEKPHQATPVPSNPESLGSYVFLNHFSVDPNDAHEHNLMSMLIKNAEKWRACLPAEDFVNQFEKNNGQTEKSHCKFPATRDKFVSLRCPSHPNHFEF